MEEFGQKSPKKEMAQTARYFAADRFSRDSQKNGGFWPRVGVGIKGFGQNGSHFFSTFVRKRGFRPNRVKKKGVDTISAPTPADAFDS